MVTRRRDPSRQLLRLLALFLVPALGSTVVGGAAADPGSPARSVAAAAPDRVAGIDVSQWQGDVDWTAVAGTNVRFVIMRATRSDDFVDPTYLTNLQEATDAGLSVGSYHRATPGGAAGDAIAEADHFVDVARNDPGDVLPVLDIEETGGLSPSGLVDWVRTWVVRVRTRLGVRPMLYASPYFWRVNMGDSLWFANHGYPLWIAHWGVSAPDVQADDWGGNGWTFWQFTSTGHVAGIGPNVDRDRFNGSDLTAGEIASLTVSPPVGGSVSGARIECGGGATRCSRSSNPGDQLTLTADPEPDASFLGWTGACAAAGTSPTCTVTAFGARRAGAVFGYSLGVALDGTGAGSVDSVPSGLDCPATSCVSLFPAGSEVGLTADPDSASGFVAWGGACAGPVPTCDVTVNGPANVTARFDATLELEEGGSGTAYAWANRVAPHAVGGAFRWERRAGATTSFGFTGHAVSLTMITGPAFGRARIAVDGATVDTFDGYAPLAGGGAALRFDELASGGHTLTVTVLGTARPRATGTRVGVDAIRSRGVVTANPMPSGSAWGLVADPSASGDGYAVSDAAGAAAKLRFVGTGVTLRTLRGPTMGVAELWVDGVLMRTLDLSAPTAAHGVLRTVTGLVDGAHVVRLVVVGASGSDGTGKAVAVDGWIVR